MLSSNSRNTGGRSLFTKKSNLKTVNVVLIILLASLSAANFARPVLGQANNELGIICGYGASDPSQPFPVAITTKDGNVLAPGTVNSSCDWAGDVDGDAALDPLVSDNPSLLPAGSGGGFIADIVITNLNTNINGFDLTLNYDTHVLDAILVDQSGLLYGGNNGCLSSNPSCTLTAALTIDRSMGQIRLSQAILGITSGPGGNCDSTANPNCLNANQELFRIRFDIVGAGTGFINFSTDPLKNVIVNPGTVPHTSQNSNLGTDALFQITNGVASGSFVDSWSFSPSPEVPGSALTFTALAATCSYCTAPFTYSWDFSSQDSATYTPKSDATGTTATVTAPPPVINRVTLTVADSAGHSVVETRRLPLMAVATGPTTVAQGVASTAFTGKWLGGVVTTSSGYSGQWRFCPGTALSHPVCNTGPIAISQTPGGITQVSPVNSVTWSFAGFYNDFMSITDTAVSQISATPNTVVTPVPVNVTGATSAYTVAVSPDVASINVGQSVTFTVTVTYGTTYPTASRSTSFNYVFSFGDGSQDTVTGSASVTATHAFNTAGSFVVKVVSQETGNASPSMIQENGYSPTITVAGAKNSPTITTTLSNTQITQGGAVTDSATLTGATSTAGGTVTYSFFTGSTCSGTGTVVGSPVTVTNGIVPNSASQTFNSAGSFSWNAIYTGDANNNGATSQCEPLTVIAIATVTITTTLSSNIITAGQSVTDSATLSGNTATAGGTVTYSFFTGSTCSGTGTIVGSPVTVTNGVVPDSAAHVFSTAGSFSWNAVYSGDSANGQATSSCEPLTVNPAIAQVTISTSLSPNPVTVGGTVTDSATLTGNTATAGGTVTYNLFATAACTGSSTIVSTVTVTNGAVPNSAAHTFTSVAPASWNAVYSGDSGNSPATSSCEPLTINKASPTISTSLSSNPITVGGSVTDSATLSNSFQASGTVVYSFFSGSSCAGTGTQVGSPVTVTSGVVPDSGSQTFNTAGGFSWNAVYSGDANNNGATSTCEPLTVNPASGVIITTTLSNNAIAVGGSVSDSATLTGVTANAGGTVTYSFFSGSTCAGTGTPVSNPVTVANGVVPNSASQVFNAAGSFSWSAVYSGDANNGGATSVCEPLTVNKASPTIATSLLSNPITIGGSVADSATLTNSFQAGGTVTYSFFTGSTCSGTGTIVGSPVTVTNSVVPDSASQTFSTAGSFSWNAVYSGDANNAGTTSACELLTVNPATGVVISTGLSTTSITVGGSVTDSATLTGVTATAGGTVTYNQFATADCTGTSTVVSIVQVTNGVVPDSASQTFTTAGTVSWNAVYSGDANNGGATSGCEPLVVNQASPTLTSIVSLSPVTVGSSVHDSASLTNAFSAGGTVTYMLFPDAACTGTGTTVSIATVTNGVVPDSSATTPSPAGSYSFQALYSGDTNNKPATSLCEPFTVSKVTPTISTTLSSNAITAGGSVSDSATLTGGFEAGGTVTYSFFTGSTCSGTGTVVGSPVTVTNGIVPTSASQTFGIAGSFSWNAVYSGDANNGAATSVCEPLTVNPAAGVVITTTLSANPVAVGGSVTDSATLTGVTSTAGGTVIYNLFSTSDCSGTATLVSTVTVTNSVVPDSASHTFSSAGTESWNAEYSGDTNNAPATSICEPQTVSNASPTITTTLSSNNINVGDSVTDSAAMTGEFQAGGTVTYSFFTGSSCSGTGTVVGSPVAVTNGVVPDSVAQVFDTAGSFSWNAAYSGDANNNGATSSCEPLTVSSPAVVTITTSLSSSSITVGGTVIDSATLAGVASNAGGMVTYYLFSTGDCSGSSTVVSTVTVTNGIVPDSASQTFSSAGSFSWNAVYSGDTNNAGATSACEPLIVTAPVPLSVDFSFSPATPQTGQSVSFVSSVSGGISPYTYAWDFGDGGSSTVANPSHAYSTAGSFTVMLTASDSSSPMLTQTASHTVIVTLPSGKPDFTISASPTALTVVGESSLCEGGSRLCDDEVSTTVTVTNLNGFNGSVRLRTSYSPSDGSLTIYCRPRAINAMAGVNGVARCTVEPEINPDSPRTFTVTIRATNGSLSHSITITLVVTNAPVESDNNQDPLTLMAPVSSSVCLAAIASSATGPQLARDSVRCHFDHDGHRRGHVAERSSDSNH